MSRVRIYQCNTYKKQSILSPPDEPLELYTWDNLLFVSTKRSVIEIYNMISLEIVGKFSTISQAENIIYSEYGNCIVTMERADNSSLHCFVRLYMGLPCRLSQLAVDPLVKESFVMVGLGEDTSPEERDRYVTGCMSRSEKTKAQKERSHEQMENWEVERIELPTQAAVNCVGMCPQTGLLAVAWYMSVTLYMLTQDTDSTDLDKPVNCDVSVMMEMEMGFVVTVVVVEDTFLACLSEFEVQVLRLQLMPKRYTCVPREKKLEPYMKTMLRIDSCTEDENEPEFKQSEDFLQLRSFYSYPSVHVDAISNGREADCYPGVVAVDTMLGDGSGMKERRNMQEEHCIIFPSVSKESMQIQGREDSLNNKMIEIWGPSRIMEHRALKVVTPDGHKLTNSGISTMLYLKLPFTVASCNEYSLSTSNIEEKSIDVFHTVKLIPEYLDEGENQHLVGMCILVASRKEGHFYDIFGYCRKVITFPFTKDLVDIVISPGLMHVIYLSRIEVYITRSYGVASENARELIKQGKVYNIDFGTSETPDQLEDSDIFQHEAELSFMSPLYWLYQVSPSPQEMDISQIGQSSFMNLQSCTNTDRKIAILSKYKPEVKTSGFHKIKRQSSSKVEEIIWSIYILDITPLHSIAKQMEMMAQPYIYENPPIYFQLLCDAHFLRKSAISREQENSFEEEEVECVSIEQLDSYVISLTPSQQHLDVELDAIFPNLANKQQFIGLQRSCLLLADFLRQENEQLSLQYYKQGSFDLNQFLTNSILHSVSTPMTVDDVVYHSLTSTTLKSMASSMCFSRMDASLLAQSILHKESLHPTESDVTENSETDCMVFKVFDLCMYLENNDEMKAKESAGELFVHSRDFNLWANDHINSFVSQENEGDLSHLGMFLLAEVPSLVVPLLPKICVLGLVKVGYVIELIKHNTEDREERDEMTLQFITDLIRTQNKTENRIKDLELAITELITLCFNLFEEQVELDTRKIDDICAEYRPHWLDRLPPFSDYETHNGNIGRTTSFIFMVQNILSSPYNSLLMSEKVLELTQLSECYDGIRVLTFMKLGRYKELVILFLNRYQRAFPALSDSIQLQAVRYTIIRCIVNDILINTGENDMLSRDLRQSACYFIISLTRWMTYKEILNVLPDNSPADLYKQCFDFHLHIEKSDKIIEELCNL